MPLKIFISSTYEDLKDCREYVIKELKKLEPILTPICMEGFHSTDEIPHEVCIKRLNDSDIYILVIGDYYGSKIGKCKIKEKFGCKAKCNGNISYTHCEYRYAKSKNMPRMCFILKLRKNNSENVKENNIEDKNNDNNIEKLKKFKDDEVKKSETVKYIKSNNYKKELVEEIRKGLPNNLIKWMSEGRVRLPNFFGRTEELKKLFEAFNKYDVLCITGVGGIGKTCLAEVLLSLKVIEGWNIIAIYRESEYISGIGYHPFKKYLLSRENENQKNEIIKTKKFKDRIYFSTIAEAITGRKWDANQKPKDILKELNNKGNVILFLDDFHLADEDVIDFIQRYSKELDRAKIVITSRTDVKVDRYIAYTLKLRGIKDKNEYYCYIDCLSKDPSDEEKSKEKIPDKYKNIFMKISKGHPLITKFLVENFGRVPLKKINSLYNAIKSLGGDEYVEEFFKRFMKEILDNDELKTLCMLSVYRTTVDDDKITKLLSISDELLKNLAKKLMLKTDEEGYMFYDDLIRECANILLEKEFGKSAKIEAHRKAAEYYKEYYEKYLKGKKKFVEYCVEYLYHLVESNNYNEALKILENIELWRNIRRSSNPDDLLQILEKLLELLENMDDIQEKVRVKIKIGDTYISYGEFNKGIGILKEVLDWDISEELKAEGCHILSFALIFTGNWIEAIKYIKKTLYHAEKTKNKELLGRNAYHIGVFYWYLSNFKGAIDKYNLGFKYGYIELFEVKWNMSDALIRLGDLKNTFQSFKEGYKLSKEMKNITYKGLNLFGYGFIIGLLGDTEKAKEFLNTAKSLFEDLNVEWGIINVVHCIGVLDHIKEDYEGAKTFYTQSQKLSRTKYYKAVTLHQLAMLYEDMNNLNKAEQTYKKALDTFEEIRFTYGKAKTLHHIGIIHELKGDDYKLKGNKEKANKCYKEAEEYYLKSLELKEDLTKENREYLKEIAEENPELKELLKDVIKDFEVKNEDKLGRAITLGQLVILKIKTKNYGEAEEYLIKAKELFEEIFLELMEELNIDRKNNIYLRTLDKCMEILKKLEEDDITHKQAMEEIKGLKFRDFLIH